MHKLKVCFVAPNIYPLLVKNSDVKMIGGAELQQFYIGQELIKRGYFVAYIVKNFDQAPVMQVGPFQVIASFKEKEGLWMVKKIWQALSAAKADVYYVRCAGLLVPIVALWCRLNRKKSIFCGANDPDFHPQELKLSPQHKRLYFFGLKMCDAIVVQNKKQQQLLKANFRREGTLISNGFPAVEEVITKSSLILWTATIKPHKRPEVFIELAKKFPSERFIMVGGLYERQKDFYERIERQAKTVSNLAFMGFLPIEEVEKFFMQAKVFVNTSEHEGFPNTFLQAWRRGIPVLSLLDLDRLIQDHDDLGQVAATPDELPKALQHILDRRSPEQSSRIKKFFNENFLVDRVVDQYEVLFNNL